MLRIVIFYILSVILDSVDEIPETFIGDIVDLEMNNVRAQQNGINGTDRR